MKRPIASTLLALACCLTGCQAVGGLQAPAPAASVGAPSPTKLGSLQFRPVSAETSKLLAERQASTQGAAPMAANATAAMDASLTAPAIARAPMPGSLYMPDMYFGGPCGPQKLDNITEADAPGLTGSWQEVQAQLIAPALADWAGDARLVQSNAVLGDADAKDNSWNVTYVSGARNEALTFNVTAKATKVTKMRWSPTSLDMAGAIEAKDAIAKLTAAIKDPNARGKEAELGKDYFFPSDTVNPAVMARPADAPMPVNATVAVDAGPGVSTPAAGGTTGNPGIAVGEPNPGRPAPKPPEEVYELPAGGRWHATFQAIADKVVWELSYEAPYDDKPGTREVVSGGYGMVDARTGDVIRLYRPNRYTQVIDPIPPGEPMPMPRPEAASKPQ